MEGSIMIFTEIGETVTMVLHMTDLEAMARACLAASECGTKGYQYETAASMFTAAAMIARVYGDMPEAITEHMARIHERITEEGDAA